MTPPTASSPAPGLSLFSPAAGEMPAQAEPCGQDWVPCCPSAMQMQEFPEVTKMHLEGAAQGGHWDGPVRDKWARLSPHHGLDTECVSSCPGWGDDHMGKATVDQCRLPILGQRKSKPLAWVFGFMGFSGGFWGHTKVYSGAIPGSVLRGPSECQESSRDWRQASGALLPWSITGPKDRFFV